MQDKPSPIRETDDEARKLARRLLRGARYASLAVLDAESGFPAVSRALLGMDVDGVPVILVSALAGHTVALRNNPRCSLLAGEPGKGDPLAHARITVFCTAEPVARDSDDHARIRARFVARHRKAELYVDFADFGFFRLVPVSAALNGGFGKAYQLSGEELTIRGASVAAEWLHPQELTGTMDEQAEAVAHFLKMPETGGWRISGADMAGFELVRGDILVRCEFETPVFSPNEIIDRIFNFAKTS
ncbi:HugZ family protein [Neorhizobium sp. NPDC001467]|uniref:HugZ family pyridoxamine 5'-phosphate oxidase n=1 Tax=Neorhizobium sp. NPDC001467 TaxID=3390595 RepID=UPI003D051F8D